MDNDRYFENDFVLRRNDEQWLNKQGELEGESAEKIKDYYNTQLTSFNSKYEDLNTHSKESVYSGLAGIGLLFLKASSNNTTHQYFSTANNLLTQADGSKHKIGFLCGRIGCITLLAHLHHIKKENNELENCLKKILDEVRYINDSCHTDELLNGRAGYLYALLYLQINKISDVPNDIVQKVVRSIIKSGLKYKSAHGIPLNYEWHGKQYIGAAHGYAGILFMLLQAAWIYPNSFEESDMHLIETSIQKLLRFQFPSKNIMSSIGSDHDRLIHWCHGAPGVIYLYLLASKVFKNKSYLKVARDFGDVIWSRGLLKRGYGLCHGVSGNAYAFLALYQSTGDMEYLEKAVKFAEWCVSRDQRTCRTPDRPDALYEGIAGVLYFLQDVLKPNDAMFPGYQLVTLNEK